MCSASVVDIAVSFAPALNRRLHFTGGEESLPVKEIITCFVMHLKGKEWRGLHESTSVSHRCI